MVAQPLGVSATPLNFESWGCTLSLHPGHLTTSAGPDPVLTPWGTLLATDLPDSAPDYNPWSPSSDNFSLKPCSPSRQAYEQRSLSFLCQMDPTSPSQTRFLQASPMGWVPKPLLVAQGVDGAALAPASFLVWWMFPLQSAEHQSGLARSSQFLGEVSSSCQSLPLQASILQHYCSIPSGCAGEGVFGSLAVDCKSAAACAWNQPSNSFLPPAAGDQHLGTPFADRSAACPCPGRKV